MHITFKSTFYYKHSKLPTCKCFGHISGLPQECTLQRMLQKHYNIKTPEDVCAFVGFILISYHLNAWSWIF